MHSDEAAGDRPGGHEHEAVPEVGRGPGADGSRATSSGSGGRRAGDRDRGVRQRAAGWEGAPQERWVDVDAHAAITAGSN